MTRKLAVFYFHFKSVENPSLKSRQIRYLDAAPPGILIWRALLQWLGGIGVIAMAIAILPLLRIGGMQLFRMESSDRSEKVLPRTTQLVAYIAFIYLGASIVCAVAYWAAGMSGFDAVAHAMTWTPRGWLPDGDLVRGEQHLYLRQPGYGTSYVTGKIQIEELLAEEALERGEDFTVKAFFDDFFDAGVIPITLTRWEMTGERHEILGSASEH